jgi:hypothetical protein
LGEHVLLAGFGDAFLGEFGGETLVKGVFEGCLVVAAGREGAGFAEGTHDGGLGVGEFVKHGQWNYFNFIYFQPISRVGRSSAEIGF